MSIQPQEKLAVDLSSLLTKLSADVNGAFAEGSISVYFKGTVMPLAGQLTMTNPALGLIHESEMVQNDPGHSDLPPVLNGLCWNLTRGPGCQDHGLEHRRRLGYGGRSPGYPVPPTPEFTPDAHSA